jgi:hypothetical protein
MAIAAAGEGEDGNGGGDRDSSHYKGKTQMQHLIRVK